MTQKFYAIVTNIGAAKIASAVSLGTKLNITHMAVGDGGGALPTPDASQTKLVNEVRRAALNSLTVDTANSSQIIAEQVIPETEGGFWIREMGLFDADGSLIAVCNTAETYKPQLQEGSGRTQRLRMMIIVSSTEAVTLKVDPSVVLATRQYADDKVIEVKAYSDDALKKHVAAVNPHNQYLQIGNALNELKGSSLIDELFKNLGLGEAAKRGVGTAQNQIPDMSYFTGLNELNGWKPLPGGLIMQWGQTERGSETPVLANFSIPFPNFAFVVIGSIYDDVNPTNATLRRKTSPDPRSCAQFFLNNGTAATSINWVAIGM
ncbi:phage tail protein [Lonsdalea britannica]|uniref:phage tail protein n=1 Tax=Lonsdalea britannica TaxID=1082704 RepID=UPI000A1D733D|nr:phage tail protein [Lonsdalea britannica]OSN07206.1 phage tail protein [Lonsdalea britannica]